MSDEVKVPGTKKQHNQKGAAMVMVLLISFLLLVASSGLLLEASMNSSNVSDAVAEQQAYAAAESGIQSVLNVLRGNVAPSPLIRPSQSPFATGNAISFNKALDMATSNLSTDTYSRPRLSRWINYNYTPSGATNPDRVTIGATTANPYSERTGYAYSIDVYDPDNTEKNVQYYTTGYIEGGTAGSRTWTSADGTATITYTPKGSTLFDCSSGLVNADVGYITVSTTGTGASIPSLTEFKIKFNMTKPYTATRTLTAYIETGTITPTSMGTVSLTFDSQAYELQGSDITFSSGTLITNPVGFRITPNAPNVAGGVTSFPVTMTPSEPTRLVVRSTGYGPRGAHKLLEAIIQRSFLNGMTLPATLTMVGSTSNFHFASGNSQPVTYSGDDVSSNILIPPIGTDNDTNLASVWTDLGGAGRKTNLVGIPANVADDLPTWLKTAPELDGIIQSFKAVAIASSTYYGNGAVPSSLGNAMSAKGITFVDGDYTVNPTDSVSGGGILIVTGKMVIKGAFDFKGVIIITGQNGLERSGGGNGVIQGNVLIAPYNKSNPSAGFLSPKYDISGGGNSLMIYNSDSMANGLRAISNFMLGVAEK